MESTPHSRDGNEHFKKRAVSLVIENRKGEILLMLRDNTPGILYPGTWVIPGGGMEDADQSPEDAIRREMHEELGLELRDIELVSEYSRPDRDEYLYCTTLDLDLVEANKSLTEGQKVDFFSWREIEQMELGFDDKDMARDFFERKSRR